MRSVHSTSGEIYTAPIIGPPVVRLVWPVDRHREIATAYSRTRSRAALERPQGIVDDVTSYSQPVRDLFAPAGRGVVVLRNREDVPDAAGKITAAVGKRADLYDALGRHVATAEFPVTLRWVTTSNAKTVTGVTKEGEPYSAAWNAPVAGQILR